MKRILACLFLTIFSFQVLPVKEIGKLLCKGFITEEEVHGNSGNLDENPSKLKKASEPVPVCLSCYSGYSYGDYTSRKAMVAIHDAQSISIQYVADIVTPPPNC